MIAGFMVVFGLGLASLSWLTPNLNRFYVTAVFIGVAGTGTYQIGYARIVASWFERRLGTALSIVVAGSGLGSLFFPPLIQHLITIYGWRHTYLLRSSRTPHGRTSANFAGDLMPQSHRRCSAVRN